jgi:hypothetical protein
MYIYINIYIYMCIHKFIHIHTYLGQLLGIFLEQCSLSSGAKIGHLFLIIVFFFDYTFLASLY